MKIELRILFIIVSYIVCALILVSVPFRRMAVSKKAGKQVMKVTGSSIITVICIYVLALLLISVLWLRNFGNAMNVVMCCCGILAFELMTREISLYKKYGIYEKAIVYDGMILGFENIAGFPVLRLPAEDQKNYDSKTLVIQTKTKGTRNFTFRTEEEYRKAVEKLFELNPDFNKMI